MEKLLGSSGCNVWYKPGSSTPPRSLMPPPLIPNTALIVASALPVGLAFQPCLQMPRSRRLGQVCHLFVCKVFHRPRMAYSEWFCLWPGFLCGPFHSLIWSASLRVSFLNQSYGFLNIMSLYLFRCDIFILYLMMKKLKIKLKLWDLNITPLPPPFRVVFGD